MHKLQDSDEEEHSKRELEKATVGPEEDSGFQDLRNSGFRWIWKSKKILDSGIPNWDEEQGESSGLRNLGIQMKRKRAGWLSSYEKLKPRIDVKTESFIQFLAELALYLSCHKDHKMEICVDQICCWVINLEFQKQITKIFRKIRKSR